MKLGCLLFVIVFVMSPTSSQYENQDTQTLSGRLILVDRDFPTGQDTSRVGSAPLRDRHYLLVGYKDSVWGLSFQPGCQPPARPGMALEVKILASELKTASAASSPDGGSSSSRSLLGVRTSNPNGKDNIGHVGPAAGGFEGDEHHSDVEFDGERLLAEGDTAQQRYGVGQVVVVSWRQVSILVEDTAGQAVDTRESSRTLDPDPNSFVYNEDDKIVMDDISTVVYILNMCGHGPAASREDLEAVFFGEGSVTLQSYFSYCSSGVARFSRRNVLILGPLELPCSGPYMYYYDGDPDGVRDSWYTSSCRPRDYISWLRYAQQWARDQGYNIDAYRHHVVLGSPNQEQWMVDGDGNGAYCDWSGLAFIGPYINDSNPYQSNQLQTFQRGAYGYAWINGDYWSSPAGWAHELGHNYYLKHATELGCEYCDATCVMGFCCDLRCFNAPHMMQLGWREPLETYDFRSLPVGIMVQRSLSASPSNPPLGSAVRIMANLWWDSAALTTLNLYEGIFFYVPYVWVSYRKASQPFDNLPVDQLNHVSIYVIYVHTYSGEASGTIKLGTMQAGQVWRNVALGLHVEVLRISSTNRGSDFATVRFCRMESEMEDSWSKCIDGVDNDCDGFIDQEDPDCASFFNYNSDNTRDSIVPIVITPNTIPGQPPGEQLGTAPDVPSPPFSHDGPDALTRGVYVPLPPMLPTYPIDSTAPSANPSPDPPSGLYTNHPWPAFPAPSEALWPPGPFELQYAREPDAPGAPSPTRQPHYPLAAEPGEFKPAPVSGPYSGGYYPSAGVFAPLPPPPSRLEPLVEHNRRMTAESRSARRSARRFTQFDYRFHAIGVDESEVHGTDVQSVVSVPAKQLLSPASTRPSLTSSSSASLSSSSSKGDLEAIKLESATAIAIMYSGQGHSRHQGKQDITRPYRPQLRGTPPTSTSSRSSSPPRLG